MLQELEIHYDGLPPELLAVNVIARLDLEHTKDPDLGKILADDVETGINLGWRWPMRVQVMAEAYHQLQFSNGSLSEKSILGHLNWNTVLDPKVSERSNTHGKPRIYREQAFCAYLAFLRTRDKEYKTGGNYKAHTSWLENTRKGLGEDHLLTGYLIKTTDSVTSQEETADEEIKRVLRSVTVAQLQDWAVILKKSPSIRYEMVSTARLVRVGIEMPNAVLDALCKLPSSFKRLDNPAAVVRDGEETTFTVFASGITLACKLLERYPEVDFYQLAGVIRENKGKGLSTLASLLKIPKSG